MEINLLFFSFGEKLCAKLKKSKSQKTSKGSFLNLRSFSNTEFHFIYLLRIICFFESGPQKSWNFSTRRLILCRKSLINCSTSYKAVHHINAEMTPKESLFSHDKFLVFEAWRKYTYSCKKTCIPSPKVFETSSEF